METMPIIEGWKMGRAPVVSRCGFCDMMMRSWDERVEHLAQHFRKGLTMDDWKGEHCFESSIAAQITNALPPYLIASESRASIPFSVTNANTIDQLSQIQNASEQGQEGVEVRANDRTIESDQGTASASLLPLLSDNVASSTSFTELLTLSLRLDDGGLVGRQLNINQPPSIAADMVAAFSEIGKGIGIVPEDRKSEIMRMSTEQRLNGSAYMLPKDLDIFPSRSPSWDEFPDAGAVIIELILYSVVLVLCSSCEKRKCCGELSRVIGATSFTSRCRRHYYYHWPRTITETKNRRVSE